MGYGGHYFLLCLFYFLKSGRIGIRSGAEKRKGMKLEVKKIERERERG